MIRLYLPVVLLVLSTSACSKWTRGADSRAAVPDVYSQRVEFEPVEVRPPSDPQLVPLERSATSGHPSVETVSDVPMQRTHVIRKGDTFWSIARKYYGDGRRAEEIARANPDLVPTKLGVGKKVLLP